MQEGEDEDLDALLGDDDSDAENDLMTDDLLADQGDVGKLVGGLSDEDTTDNSTTDDDDMGEGNEDGLTGFKVRCCALRLRGCIHCCVPHMPHMHSSMARTLGRSSGKEQHFCVFIAVCSTSHGAPHAQAGQASPARKGFASALRVLTYSVLERVGKVPCILIAMVPYSAWEQCMRAQRCARVPLW